MSDWDEAVEDRLADAGYLATAVDEDDDHVTLVEAPVGEVIRIAREALLSDEAVERAARALYEGRVAIIEDPDERRFWPAWEDHERDDADSWRDMARSALTAAIGDE